jgi:hypothetical protein
MARATIRRDPAEIVSIRRAVDRAGDLAVQQTRRPFPHAASGKLEQRCGVETVHGRPTLGRASGSRGATNEMRRCVGSFERQGQPALLPVIHQPPASLPRVAGSAPAPTDQRTVRAGAGPLSLQKPAASRGSQDMATQRHSILVGKCYRDAFGAIYRIVGFNGDVVQCALYHRTERGLVEGEALGQLGRPSRGPARRSGVAAGRIVSGKASSPSLQRRNVARPVMSRPGPRRIPSLILSLGRTPRSRSNGCPAMSR